MDYLDRIEKDTPLEREIFPEWFEESGGLNENVCQRKGSGVGRIRNWLSVLDFVHPVSVQDVSTNHGQVLNGQSVSVRLGEEMKQYLIDIKDFIILMVIIFLILWSLSVSITIPYNCSTQGAANFAETFSRAIQFWNNYCGQPVPATWWVTI